MPCIAYKDRRFGTRATKIIEHAVDILDEYTEQGFVLTLRQLYYQFVARDLFENKERNYRDLSHIISEARLAGLVDWDHLTDRTRNLASLEHFESGQDALNKLADWFHVDMWANQPYRPEVWIEKDALVGVIEGICNALDVPYFSCRGYTSQSEMWRAARRLATYQIGGQVPCILHFGDHDPSGIDMSRDIMGRLKLFVGKIPFERIAMNMDQIEAHKPPPNPAKVTDARFNGYVQEFGTECWELDALEPKVIAELLSSNIRQLINNDTWAKDLQRKEEVKARLYKYAEKWKE